MATGKTAAGNIILPIEGGAQKVTLTASETVILGNSNAGKVSKWMIHAKVGGASPGSCIPKKRVRGSGLTGTDLIAPVYYKDTSSTEIASGTAITANDIYEVVVDGCDLALVYTTGADGMILYCIPVIG